MRGRGLVLLFLCVGVTLKQSFCTEFNVFMGALKIAKSDTRGAVGTFILHEESSEILHNKTTLSEVKTNTTR